VALTVRRSVVATLAAQAARSVPGVVALRRGGPPLVRRLRGRAIDTSVEDGSVRIRIWLAAREAESLVKLSRRVRHDVALTIERQLGLVPADVTVIVDGVGG
jgi:uncharacterized alkaline shock family protein YloU